MHLAISIVLSVKAGAVFQETIVNRDEGMGVKALLLVSLMRYTIGHGNWRNPDDSNLNAACSRRRQAES